MTLIDPILLASLIDYFSLLTVLEWTAMLLSLAYIILAAQGSLWCWPAAFVSTALYSFIFFEFLLLMDSVLNAYYLVMAVYGFWSWQKNKENHNNQSIDPTVIQKDTADFVVVTWAGLWHLKACLLLVVISLIAGYLMANYTPADFPYLDTFTTVYAIFATYLVVHKVLENWLYWLVIDAVSIYLYVEKGLYPTALLFIIFVGIACYGYWKWRNILEHSTPNQRVDNSFA